MGRYGMAGDHYRQSGYVTLQDVPDPNREYVESFANLTGGMNRFDLDYRLKGNESPFLQNLSWHNGTLTSRLGQVELEGDLSTSYKLPGETLLGEKINYVSASPFLYYGWMFVQAETDSDYEDKTQIYVVKMQKIGIENEADLGTVEKVGLTSSVPHVKTPGTFFRYRENVYFKAVGVYFSFYHSGGDQISLDSSKVPFVPVVQRNTNPASGAGDKDQEENRLTDRKIVEFNFAVVSDQDPTVFQLPYTGVTWALVYDGGPHDPDNFYDIDLERTDYSTGKIVTQTVPQEDNVKVYISFDAPNPDAKGSIMNSPTAIVFGGAQELCVVMGGPEAQPNAYFWSGLGKGDAMDPMYFPMNQYNLAGDNDDPITAFGKQQNMLIIFQPHATGRAVFGMEQVNGRETITMNYTRINAEIGCDLPGSLQLVENNLVWCDRKYGVCRLKDSSAAYENNIVQISRKINGDYRLDGLLEQLKSVADDAVRSTDTGKRYILVLGDEDGKAYEWNYELSEYSNPSWFYHTGILGVGFVPLANEELYEVTEDGKVATFEPVFSDFGTTAIEKIYRFPPRDFGSYDRLKNIKSILVTTRSDSKTNTTLRYICDYTERNDPTNLVVTPNERNFAVIFRRKPGYHNIHHLGIELSNNTAGDDLNIVSAQIFYEYRGRVR